MKHRIMSNFEYAEHIDLIKNVWIDFVEKSQYNNEMIRSEIIDSWKRSKSFGVDPFQPRVKKIVEQEELMYKRERNEELLSFALPNMKYLCDFLTGSDTIITITDKNGVILNSFGDKSILKKGEKVGHVPGADWSEEVAGTNAIGTVIKTKKPILVLFTEHFCTGWHDWYCAAASILDPLTNELLGVFDLSGKRKDVNPHTLGLAISQANLISNIIEKCVYQYRLQVNPFLATSLNSHDDGILILNKEKKILKMNAQLESYLRGRDIQTIDSIPELNRLVDLVLEGKEQFIEHEITLNDNNRKYICSVLPIIINYDLLGVVIRFRGSLPSRNSTSIQQTSKYTFDNIIGSSPTFLRIVNKARKAAMIDSTLFLYGETGTGKEMFAQAIHNASARRHKPFVAINCGAIPRDLIESELFGYEPGAFTGAKSKGSPGKFELAQGGTIFLDEIGDMPLNVQVHLLRVLEERVVTRIGGEKPIPIDVRIIAATHKDLREAVREGKFREDLLHRLLVIQLKIPPLRERTEDIPLLVKHFIERLGPQFGKTNVRVSSETMEYLKKYPWPGNIRELRNVIEQSLFNMEGDTLLPYDLPPELKELVENPITSEKDKLINAIKTMNGNITNAAKKLGISRATMYRKMKKYNITASQFKEKRNS